MLRKGQSFTGILGWAITAGVTLFLLLDVAPDLRHASFAIRANAGLGIPASVVLPVGLIGLVCAVLYVVPQTAMLGAILLTGFLGGAVATHLRVHGSMHDMGENILIGALAWTALWLRDPRLRPLLPLRRP